MRHEYRKIARITDELITYFLEQQAKDISLDLKYAEEKEIIIIKAHPVENIEKVVEELQEVLSYPRESEMEEYYWELAGECDYSSQLAIIGTMIDTASIDYNDESIHLELVRNK